MVLSFDINLLFFKMSRVWREMKTVTFFPLISCMITHNIKCIAFFLHVILIQIFVPSYNVHGVIETKKHFNEKSC
jgi:hypothetical protein